MSKITVGVKYACNEVCNMDMEEDEFMFRAGQMGGCYTYGEVIEIHFECGYLKRNRLDGKILKATLYAI